MTRGKYFGPLHVAPSVVQGGFRMIAHCSADISLLGRRLGAALRE
jgi:hypothetical protein